MLAKIKEAKKIRASLVVQNELSDPDNVWHIVVNVIWPYGCYFTRCKYLL
jgi:hypothetical protein